MPSSLQHPVKYQVKVCGVRDPGDVAALDNLGVHWLGFNFFPKSARYIDPETAASLIRGLKKAVPVGVFVDETPEKVLEIVRTTGIRYVQLHGSESWDYVIRMPVPVIKAIPSHRLADWGGLRAGLEPVLRAGGKADPLAYFLVDTQSSSPVSGSVSGTTFGGTGHAFDWSLLASHPLPLPYFLAGGLGPQNLAEALRACTPVVVDLNSKVETAPSKKDLEKVKACLEILSGAP